MAKTGPYKIPILISSPMIDTPFKAHISLDSAFTVSRGKQKPVVLNTFYTLFTGGIISDTIGT